MASKKKVPPSPAPPPRPRDVPAPPPPRALSLNLAPLAPNVITTFAPAQPPTVDLGTYINLDGLTEQEFERLQSMAVLMQQAIATVAKAAEPNPVPRPTPAPTPPPGTKA